MRLRRVLASLTFVSLACLPSLASPLGGVRLSLMQGDVQTRTEESGGWVFAAVNAALGEGDELWVPEGGKAELVLSDGTFVRLDYSTAVQILRVSPTFFQLSLSQGRAYVRFSGRPATSFELDAPQATVRADAPCSFDVELSGDSTDVSEYRGSVVVDSSAGTVRVSGGNVLTLTSGGAPQTTPLGAPDEWEAWNRLRNEELLAEGPSDRYLPEELRPYGADLDRGGSWVDTREYGKVWIPADAADEGWAPYRSGRWVWRGGDYVWVGYEPWGWAPYHYGRWAFVPPVGWCWVPPLPGDVFWGPGFVGWIRTPDYVGWVPLAPRETYYGRGRYGRDCVDVTRVNPASIRFPQHYRNGDVRNGVIVVHRNTFVSGAPPPVPFNHDDVRRRIYTRQNMIAGRPPIDPVRTSYMPVVKPIPPPLLPPPSVDRIRVDAVRNARPQDRHHGDAGPRPVFVPLPLPVPPPPGPRRRPEHANVPAPGRDDRGRPDERQRDRDRDRGPKVEEPRRGPPPEAPKPDRGDIRRAPPPQAPAAPQPERRPEAPPRQERGRFDDRGATPPAAEPRRDRGDQPPPVDKGRSGAPAAQPRQDRGARPPEAQPQPKPGGEPRRDRGDQPPAVDKGRSSSPEAQPRQDRGVPPQAQPQPKPAGEQKRDRSDRPPAVFKGAGSPPEAAPRQERGGPPPEAQPQPKPSGETRRDRSDRPPAAFKGAGSPPEGAPRQERGAPPPEAQPKPKPGGPPPPPPPDKPAVHQEKGAPPAQVDRGQKGAERPKEQPKEQKDGGSGKQEPQGQGR